jgi:hypothetical protein
MGTCGCKSGPSPAVALIEDQLDCIEAVFPGTHFVCVLGPMPKSELLASRVVDEAHKPDEVIPLITHLKRVAAHFANTLESKSVDCSTIHIKGAKSIFSCYNVEGSNLLAFYSTMHGAELEAFDLAAADAAMVPIIDELSVLVATMPASKR